VEGAPALRVCVCGGVSTTPQGDWHIWRGPEGIESCGVVGVESDVEVPNARITHCWGMAETRIELNVFNSWKRHLVHKSPG